MVQKSIPWGIVLILIISAPVLGALEIGTDFNFGNLGFSKERIDSETTFYGIPAIWPWGVGVYANHEFSDGMGVHTSFHIDPILRNSLYTIFTFSTDYLTIKAGPFVGLFNSLDSMMKAGISTYIKLEYPGLLFVSFRADSSIGARLVQEGDYLQEVSDIEFGFYVPNAICSISMENKSYTEKRKKYPTDASSSIIEVVDTQTTYAFKTDIYRKNSPYRVLLTFAYQTLKKGFTEGSETIEHSLNSLLLSVEGRFEVTRFLTLRAQIDSSVYAFGFSDTNLMSIRANAEIADTPFLFNGGVGFLLNIDDLITSISPIQDMVQ